MIIAEPELLDEEAVAPPVDEAVVAVPEEVLPTALAVVFEAKNQSAASGFPKPV